MATYVTDSQSLLAALKVGSHNQTDPTNTSIWRSLRGLGAKGWSQTMQFVFSHCDLPHNDLADEAARDACNLDLATHDAVPLARRDAVARVKRVLWREWADVNGGEGPYASWLNGHRAPRVEGLTRRADLEVRRLRTGHHALLRPYLSRDVWQAATPEERSSKRRNCPLCGQPTSLPHLFLDCLGGNALPARLTTLVPGLSSWPDVQIKPGTVLKELLFGKTRLALEYLQGAGFIGPFRLAP